MKNIFLVNHASRKTGSMNYFEDYLIRKNLNVSRLSHPLDNYHNEKTYYFENKTMIKSYPRYNLGIINLVLDFFITIFFLLPKKINIYIGANNFDTFVGICLKKIGKKIDKIIFFGSDFSENRFKNHLLDKIYNYIERVVVKNADFTISNTIRAEQKRISMGLLKEKSFVIPNGIYIADPSFPEKSIAKNKFIFIGSLTKEHGLFDFIKFFYKNISELVVIGIGEEFDSIVNFCKKNNISLNILGAQTHEFVINFLKSFNGFGLAPYNLDSKWTYYCSPSKIGEYVACGIPVVMSSVPEIASYVKKNELGLIFESFCEEELRNLQNSIMKFNTNEYCKKAETFYIEFKRDTLYKKLDFLFQ